MCIRDREILESAKTSYSNQFGSYIINPLAEYIYKRLNDVRKAQDAYKKEMADAKAMFGGTDNLLGVSSGAEVPTGNAVVTNNDNDKDDKNTPSITPYIELKPAEGSLADLEAKLSDLRERQRKAPLEAIVTFSVDIANLQSDIASTQSIINKMNFQAAHPVKPTDLDAAPVDGRFDTTSSLKFGVKDGGLKDMKLEPMHFDIQDPLTGMERWNEAVGLAREKNQELTDNMGAMESTARNIYLFFACFSSFLRRFSSSFCRSLSVFSRASFSRSCCNSSRAFSASSRLFCAEAFIFCSNLLSCGDSFLEVSFLDSIPPILHAPIAPSMRQISII